MLGLHCKAPARPLAPVGKPWELVKPREDEQHDEVTRRIRCPLCEWQPKPATMWACESYGTPEPYFGGCGTLWHTFATKGRCPGCAHQWQWTSCPHCDGWSPHADWYVERGGA